MFDKIKQVLILLQEAPPVDFTGGILSGIVGDCLSPEERVTLEALLKEALNETIP